MKAEKKEVIEEWYKKADEDLLAAKIVIAASPLLYDVAAFHSQQGAEKYLKAYFVYFEIMPPKIHDIKLLMDFLSGFDLSINEIRFAEHLSGFAIRSRYPDDFEIESENEAMEILKTAEAVKDFVQNKIGF